MFSCGVIFLIMIYLYFLMISFITFIYERIRHIHHIPYEPIRHCWNIFLPFKLLFSSCVIDVISIYLIEEVSCIGQQWLWLWLRRLSMVTKKTTRKKSSNISIQRTCGTPMLVHIHFFAASCLLIALPMQITTRNNSLLFFFRWNTSTFSSRSFLCSSSSSNFAAPVAHHNLWLALGNCTTSIRINWKSLTNFFRLRRFCKSNSAHARVPNASLLLTNSI
jgi:hypothetical protein